MWRGKYKNKDFYWGLKPDTTLKKVIKYAPRGIALDIGAGEGRNSIFLAKNNFNVIAIDAIKEGLIKLKHFANKQNLEINTKTIDIKKFKFSHSYSLIISIAAIDFLKQSEIKQIIKKIKKKLAINGIVYFSVFSIKDPSLNFIKKSKLQPVGKNTFYIPKIKSFKHFFTKNELKKYFNDFKIIYLKEKRIKDTSHGEPHFHNIIELIAKKA